MKNQAVLGRISPAGLWGRFAAAYQGSFMRKPVTDLMPLRKPERPLITREEVELSGFLDEIRAENGPRGSKARREGVVDLTSTRRSLMAEIFAAAERDMLQSAPVKMAEFEAQEEAQQEAEVAALPRLALAS